MPDGSYVRFQGTVCNEQGAFPGVFGLANRLAREGKLSAEQYRFWRANNDWYDANYPDPSEVDPLVYAHETHPGAVAWFKASSKALITRVDGYLELLAAHGVECRRMESSEPGKIIYEDEYQVVVIPHERHETSVNAASQMPEGPHPETRITRPQRPETERPTGKMAS